MARSTISIARSTPAQKPLGWANTTRMVFSRRDIGAVMPAPIG
jgi:hypothetical protein